MRKVFSFIFRQSVAIILIVLLVLGGGVWATLSMNVNLLPDINVPMVCVQVIYPGASASAVESEVTEKVEDGVSAIGGVKQVESYSYDNLSAVIFSFDYGSDTKGRKREISEKLTSVDLPDGVQTSVYEIDLNASAVAALSLTSENGLDDAYLKAKEISAKLSSVDGVERTAIKGGADYSYNVKPFGGLELLCPLLAEAFSYGELNIPLGSITEGDNAVQIRNNTDIKKMQDIADTVITLPADVVTLLSKVRAGIMPQLEAGLKENNLGEYQTLKPLQKAFVLEQVKKGLGANESTKDLTFSGELIDFIITSDFEKEGAANVKVGSVAKVERQPSYTSYAYYFDGAVSVASGEGVVIEVYKSNGANSSSVVKQVKKICKGISSEAGYAAEIKLLDDQSEFISDSISNVLISMLIGGALAIIIIYAFLKKVRASLVIAVTMPLSVLAALICLFLCGVTLNMVSLGGLAVGIGMLVDNSIVVIECISKHRDRDKSPFEAAVDGTLEVGGALFASTLTTVCVFIPIMLTGGLTAEIFTHLSLAVIFSLMFSLIIAVTIIPALYVLFSGGKRMLKGGTVCETQLAAAVPAPEEIKEEGKKSFRQKIAVLKQPVIMNKLTDGYAKILPKTLSRKLITILVAVAVFGSSIGLLFLTGTEFLPSVDKGIVEVNMSYPANARLENIQYDVLEFTESIRENIDGIEHVSVSVGKSGLIALTDSGVITVQLKNNRRTEKTVKRIRALAAGDKKPEGAVTVRQIDGVVASLSSGSGGISVTLLGADGEKLIEIADKISEKLIAAGFTDVVDSSSEKSLQYTLDFDRAKLIEYGLDYKTVALTLRMGIASYTACTVNIGGEECNLNISFADGAVNSKSKLENFTVGFTPTGAIKLKDVLKGNAVTEETTEACIRRLNGTNEISVSASHPDEDTGSAGKKMKKITADVLKDYEGYSFKSAGMTSYLDEAFDGLIIALVISVFLLYAVMAVQFSSFIKPLIVMASIPFSFTGGFLALVITGTTLNVVSFIGLIMLMGVVVNNAIVMLDKIKQLKAEGMPHFEAVTKACCVRLRPILMTTLTTVLALIPLAVGIGKGSELMQPLGIVVIGGLLIGTLVTLIIVPAVYCAVHRLSPKFPEGKKRVKKQTLPQEEKNA